MFFNRCGLPVIVAMMWSVPVFAGTIHVNQLGYYSDGVKTAIATGATSNSFSLVTDANDAVVFTKDLGPASTWDASNESARVADFSEFTTPGEYRIKISGCTDSYTFRVGADVCLDLAKASIRALYYNRASMALESQYAGKWARAAGHPDNSVTIHPSAASSTRPSGSKISSPGGWYDAGDYGKYITNSGLSTYTLFAAYQAFPQFYDTLKLNIPESSNQIPDILDEALYNFNWMMSMQDPADGGVYHKLTTANFCGFVMPANDNAARYVVMKTAPAALDFAAVAAQVSRIFRKFEPQMPGYSQKCLDAALAAWKWARANRTVLYSQSDINNAYDPDISTGEYGDTDITDEFQWAATELYLATRADSFFTIAYPAGKLDDEYSTPGCTYGGSLALYSLFLSRDSLTSAISLNAITSALSTFAGRYDSVYATSPYKTTMAKTDFYWGSNSVAANMGMACIMGYLAGNDSFKDAATGVLDYLLGKNPANYSYVTGVGDKTPMNIHHRPSGADNIADPVPGFLVGGPNPGQEDKSQCTYPSTLPALSYTDNQNSYASNEVAINWNAPLAFLSGACEALQNVKTSVDNVDKEKKVLPSACIRSSVGSIGVLIPSHWKSGWVTLTDLRGRVLEKVSFTSDRALVLHHTLPAQVVVVTVTAKEGSFGWKTMAAEIVAR